MALDWDGWGRHRVPQALYGQRGRQKRDQQVAERLHAGRIDLRFRDRLGLCQAG